MRQHGVGSENSWTTERVTGTREPLPGIFLPACWPAGSGSAAPAPDSRGPVARDSMNDARLLSAGCSRIVVGGARLGEWWLAGRVGGPGSGCRQGGPADEGEHRNRLDRQRFGDE